jgi:transcriptional regulator with XRE-family HTH domain
MTISKIERGKLVNPEYDTLQRLAVALNSTPANLLTSDDTMSNAA